MRRALRRLEVGAWPPCEPGEGGVIARRRPALVIVVELEEAPRAYVVADDVGAEFRMLDDALGRSCVEREAVEALRHLLLALLDRREDPKPGLERLLGGRP